MFLLIGLVGELAELRDGGVDELNEAHFWFVGLGFHRRQVYLLGLHRLALGVVSYRG
jgi:hypothetical protein